MADKARVARDIHNMQIWGRSGLLYTLEWEAENDLIEYFGFQVQNRLWFLKVLT